MKIAYIINEYPKVSHSFIRREIISLEHLGFEIQRIALRGWTGPTPDEMDCQERTRTRYVLRTGPSSLIMPTLRRLISSPLRFAKAVNLTLKMARQSDRSTLHHLAYFVEACCILEWTIAFGARCIHAHFGTNSTDVAMLVHVLGGPPYSFTVHGPEEFIRPIGLHEKIRRAAFVVAISSFGRSQLSLWTPYADWSKIKVVHCGIEKTFYENVPAAYTATPKFVCVGRLVAEKGQFLLVKAIATLRDRGVKLELVLAGDGPIRGQLEELIRTLRLQELVHITGWVSSDRVRQEIMQSRALVLPSFAEGLPVVLMEAMALRRPVISTYIAGIPELVLDGETGWLIPAASIDELALALERCLATPAERMHVMGITGRNRAVERHAIEKQAAALAKLFRAYDLVA